jgi:D-glycero-D-manno-heptose 1,7-bisphosphate phosphatase
MIKHVFLDRDGVVNRKLPEGKYVTRWEEFELLPGAAEAIAALNRSGRKVILVTNQRGVALGVMSRADVEEIHRRMGAELALQSARLDAIYYCPHDRGECGCRKPATGMITAAWRDFAGAGPENSILIGDSLSDIECGRAAGMGTILLEGAGSPERAIRKPGAEAARLLADDVVESLRDAVGRLL